MVQVQEALQSLTAASTSGMQLAVLSWTSSTTSTDQNAVLGDMKGYRKCILTTAPFHFQVHDVAYVVDCGLTTVSVYDPVSKLSHSLCTPVSKVVADARASIAGQHSNGKCYRLYLQEAYTAMEQEPVPQLQRCESASYILLLKALGVHDVTQFDFIAPPSRASLCDGLEVLYALGALDHDGNLTQRIGRPMAELPLAPRLARILLAAGDAACTKEMASIVAMLSVPNVFQYSSGLAKRKADAAYARFAVQEGDLLTLLNVYDAFVLHRKSRQWAELHYFHYPSLCAAHELRSHLVTCLNRLDIPMLSSGDDTKSLVRCILSYLFLQLSSYMHSGFFMNTAQLQPGGMYTNMNGEKHLEIHPLSVLHASGVQWIVYSHTVCSTQRFMKHITPVHPRLIADIAYVHNQSLMCLVLILFTYRHDSTSFGEGKRQQALLRRWSG